MSEVTTEELNSALEEAGLLEVFEKTAFPYGFKIAEIDGKKYLKALTQQEYITTYKAETGKDPSEEELQKPSCVAVGSSCESQGCNTAGGYCTRGGNPQGGYICYCVGY